MCLNYLFICLNIIFVLKSLFYFFPEYFISILLGIRESSDLDTRVQETWRILREVLYSRPTNLAGFRLHSSTPAWFNILK
jgi:hypothetical protein